jgi:CcmD family protein
MLYLTVGFCVVWVCHFAYLVVIDGQARQLQRRLEARSGASPAGT